MKKNDEGGTQEVAVLEKDFLVVRFKNEGKNPTVFQQEVNLAFIQFHFCLKGQLNFLYNSGSYNFPLSEDNSMLLYNPQKALPIEVEMQPQSWLVSIAISIKKFHSLFSNDAEHITFLSPENNAKKFYDTKVFTPSMAVVISQILQAKIHPSMRNLYLRGKVYELLSLFFNVTEENAATEQCPFLLDEENVRRIRSAKTILLNRMTDPPTLESLAAEIGLNIKKLKEGFKQLYGDTVYAYLLDHKMEEARRMLEERQYNVNEVGMKLGYSTASHFIAAFKKKFGTTPKKYLMSLSS
ncbi:MAG: AraC family transcriptional regulator [Flavobacteriales bacterium MED-G22]|nr:MAG: AraC family transcriptional regulator [Flavobacteriales bacterium MED-G22]|tara:strand:- start:112 stop:999 length:888 start_codon:yes stop_codon:yes gene_type:complete